MAQSVKRSEKERERDIERWIIRRVKEREGKGTTERENGDIILCSGSNSQNDTSILKGSPRERIGPKWRTISFKR